MTDLVLLISDRDECVTTEMAIEAGGGNHVSIEVFGQVSDHPGLELGGATDPAILDELDSHTYLATEPHLTASDRELGAGEGARFDGDVEERDQAGVNEGGVDLVREGDVRGGQAGKGVLTVVEEIFPYIRLQFLVVSLQVNGSSHFENCRFVGSGL